MSKHKLSKSAIPIRASALAIALLSACNLTVAQTPEQSPDKAVEGKPVKPDAKPQATERIVVTASPFEREAKDSLQATEVLDEAGLRRNRANSLGDALTSIPGVQSSSFGPGSSRPIIRGQDGARVKVLQNGTATLDASTISPDHAVTADLGEVEQVEVILGPSTLLYGSGAIGGVVNLSGDRIPKEPTDRLRGAVDIFAQWANRERAMQARLEGGAQSVAWHVHGSSVDTDNIRVGRAGTTVENGDGSESRVRVQPNTDLRATRGGGALSWVRDDAYFGAGVHRIETNYGVPGAEAVRIDLKQTRTDIAGEWRGSDKESGLTKVRLNAVNNDYVHKEIEPSGEVGTTFKNKASEFRTEASFAATPTLKVVAGVQLHNRKFSALGEESIIPQTKSNEHAVFAVAEQSFGPLVAELGARVERTRHTPSNDIEGERILPTRSFDARSAAIAAQWRPNASTRLGISLTHSERAPAIEELYSFGPHAATQTFDIGNPALRKETANGIDINLRGESKAHGLSWRVSVFHNRYRNYIYQSSVDTDADGVADRLDDEGELATNGEFLVQIATPAKARFIGGEASLSWVALDQAGQRLKLRTFVDTVRARVDTDDMGRVNVPRLSPTRFGNSVEWQSGPVAAALTLLHVQRAKRLASFETATPAYSKVDFDARYKAGGYEFYLRANNLLDRTIRVHTSYLKDVAPMMGRSFGIGMQVRWH